MSAPRVTVAADPMWFRAAVTIPASASESFLNDLAAAFAEDPERIAEQLLALHELNQQLAADRANGDDGLAEETDGFADQVRAALAEDLPLDVSVSLKEEELRSLSEAALFAARKTFSARTRAGHDPLRKATPLRSAA